MQPTDSHVEPTAAHWDVGELSDLLEAIVGIAGVEIDLREDGSPRIRVQLDGSIAGSVVSSEVRRVLTQRRSEESNGGVGRRAGLGRDLADILAADVGSQPPTHLRDPAVVEPQPMPINAPLSSVVPTPSLALIAVEEVAGGISVRAADSAGGVAFSPVEDPRSLNQAVVSSVARLRQEKPLPRLSGVEMRDVAAEPVLTVVLSLVDGKRLVGSSLVVGGMPFTLGRAVWAALASDR
ncbi:MAG: hypothetical protein GY722_06480 [bacterium]|nr:hypothetical protein [bacterium]